MNFPLELPAELRDRRADGNVVRLERIDRRLWQVRDSQPRTGAVDRARHRNHFLLPLLARAYGEIGGRSGEQDHRRRIRVIPSCGDQVVLTDWSYDGKAGGDGRQLLSIPGSSGQKSGDARSTYNEGDTA